MPKRQTENEREFISWLWQFLLHILCLSWSFISWLWTRARWIHSKLSDIKEELRFVIDHYRRAVIVITIITCVLYSFDLLKKHGIILKFPVSVLSFYCHTILAFAPDEIEFDAHSQIQTLVFHYFIGCLKTVFVADFQKLHPRLCAFFLSKETCTEEGANDVHDHLKKAINKAKVKMMQKDKLISKVTRIHVLWLVVECCINVETELTALIL